MEVPFEDRLRLWCNRFGFAQDVHFRNTLVDKNLWISRRFRIT